VSEIAPTGGQRKPLRHQATKVEADDQPANARVAGVALVVDSCLAGLDRASFTHSQSFVWVWGSLFSMAILTDDVVFDPDPLRVDRLWVVVATHPSGQQEHIVGFHTEVEAKEWRASRSCSAWLRTRGYVGWRVRQQRRPRPNYRQAPSSASDGARPGAQM
jgi:hypothetical protein